MHEETNTHLLALRYSVHASMRPRADARGNFAGEGEGEGGEPASMRPRADARGNAARPRRVVVSPACFNEASCRCTRKQTVDPDALTVYPELQ